MDLSDKLTWFIVIAAVASVMVVGMLKLGNVVVRRRTAALLAAHGEDDEEQDEGTPREG